MAEIKNYTLNFGPQHPATHTTLRLVLDVERQASSERYALVMTTVAGEGNTDAGSGETPVDPGEGEQDARDHAAHPLRLGAAVEPLPFDRILVKQLLHALQVLRELRLQGRDGDFRPASLEEGLKEGGLVGLQSLGLLALFQPPILVAKETLLGDLRDVEVAPDGHVDDCRGDVQGVGGIHAATEVFLKKIRAVCTRYGAQFVADSVQCGYGRTGRFFSHDQAGIAADIYTTAKGMGNGFPVAGVWIAPHLQPAHGMLGTTFGGNPLACAAALAVAEVIEKEKLVQNAADLGAYLRERLQGLPGVLEVRGRGLMIGLEMAPEMADRRSRLLYEKGIFTGEAKPSVIRLLPSLALTRDEADHFLAAFEDLVRN